MGYRNIFIENDCKVNIKNEQIVIKKNNLEAAIPLEDVNSIIIDNLVCNLNVYFLNKLSQYNILLYICNDKHLPTTILLNINSYCRQIKRIEEQISISKPLQKGIWKNIIIQKVRNQATCLKLLKIEGYEQIESLSKSVQSGDITNVESTAAMLYFKMLYGKNFARRTETIINSALNYGYAIIRGMIARTLAAYGFETSIGIFHHNQLNNFNLADDLIECFRPLVDLYITTNIPKDALELNSQIKRDILNVTNQLIKINNKKYNIQNAIEQVIISLAKTYKERKNCLVLPQLIALDEYKFL